MLFSICIPSYNRGHRALALVQRLLEMDESEEEIEIICSNNGSVKNKEGYETLKHLSDKRFFYHEFEENKGFVGNIEQVIKMAHGDFCMLLSDEDWVVKENLQFYRMLLEKHQDIGVVRCRTGYAYADLEDQLATAGNEALRAFYMRGIYVSGLILNRRMITDAVVDDYAKKYKTNLGYQYYPHLFFSAEALLRGHFYASSVWLVTEGATEDDLVLMEEGTTIAAYDAHETVLDQMSGFVEQISDFEVDAQMKVDMLIMVYQQSAFLIENKKEQYQKANYNYPEIMRDTAARMKQEIARIGIKLPENVVEALEEYVDSITICGQLV